MKNCDRIRQWLLLAASGELPSRHRRRMEEHVASCEDCRAFASLLGPADAAGACLPDSGPSDRVLHAIRVAAQEHCAARTPVAAPWSRPPILALALAASLVVSLAGWFLVGREGRAERIHTMKSAITMVVAADSQEVATTDAERPDLRALARQLLAMEGLSLEETGEDDLFNRLEELPPTAPLSRSTHEPGGRRRV